MSNDKLSQILQLKNGMTPSTMEPVLPTLIASIRAWPPSKRFPALDILRLAAVKAPEEVPRLQDIIDTLIDSAELSEGVMLGRRELDNNCLLVLRTFVNLFETERGRGTMLDEFVKVFSKAVGLI
jgi:PUL domain